MTSYCLQPMALLLFRSCRYSTMQSKRAEAIVTESAATTLAATMLRDSIFFWRESNGFKYPTRGMR
jgi:hypothetical protein